MMDYYPGKRATNQTEVLFHFLPPLAQFVIANSFSKGVPLPATISIHGCAQTNANFSRLFLATEPRSGISGRSWPLGTELPRVDQVIVRRRLLARNGHCGALAGCPLSECKAENTCSRRVFRILTRNERHIPPTQNE